MMTIIVEEFAASGLTVSEDKTETMLMRVPETPRVPGEPTLLLRRLFVEAADQKGTHTSASFGIWAIV